MYYFIVDIVVFHGGCAVMLGLQWSQRVIFRPGTGPEFPKNDKKSFGFLLLWGNSGPVSGRKLTFCNHCIVITSYPVGGPAGMEKLRLQPLKLRHIIIRAMSRLVALGDMINHLDSLSTR